MRAHLLRALAAGLLLASPAAARAHGRFPEAGQVAVDPSDERRLYLRTTYGLLTSPDHESWYWTCPEAVGFDADIEDPAIVVTANGTLVVGTFDGLVVSSREACQFDFVGGDLAGRTIVDVQPEADPSHVVAVSTNCKVDLSCEVHLWESSDDAASWTEAGTSPPGDFLALSLGLSASDPQRIYLSGKNQPPLEETGALMRSDDRGATWTRLAVPDSHVDALPYLAGVDPDDADRLYLGRIETDPNDRTNIIGFALLVSDDGGQSWQTAFERAAEISGFALSPDGDRLALGGPKEGLWLGDAASLQLAKVSEIHTRCLQWTEAGIYACTDQFLDGFNLGLSTDEGKTFAPLSELSSPCGPPAWCASDTSVGAECPGAWIEEKIELAAVECGEPPAPAPPPPEPKGCGCRAAGAPSSPSSGGAALLLGALMSLRRRLRGVAPRRRGS